MAFPPLERKVFSCSRLSPEVSEWYSLAFIVYRPLPAKKDFKPKR